MDEGLIMKAAAVGVVFAALFAGERIRSAVPYPTGRRRLVRNGGLWLLALAASPLVIAPLTALGANTLVWMRGDWMTAGWVGAAVLLVDLVLLDKWTYWLHRAYHRIPLMWRLHEVHHRDEFLDTTSAVRFHVGEIALSAGLRLLPIALLAIPLQTVLIYEALLLCAALFHHSNLKIPDSVERPLSRVIVTPSIHWVHHHAVREDTDSNYASILSVWDPLFASRSATRRTPDMEIGTEGVGDTTFLGLLLSPLKRRGR